MLNDYWWVFILVIFVIMFLTPNKVQKFKNTKKYKNKKMNFDTAKIMKNLPSLTSYYIGIS
jgi:hypothetical protein